MDTKCFQVSLSGIEVTLFPQFDAFIHLEGSRHFPMQAIESIEDRATEGEYGAGCLSRHVLAQQFNLIKTSSRGI